MEDFTREWDEALRSKRSLIAFGISWLGVFSQVFLKYYLIFYIFPLFVFFFLFYFLMRSIYSIDYIEDRRSRKGIERVFFIWDKIIAWWFCLTVCILSFFFGIVLSIGGLDII